MASSFLDSDFINTDLSDDKWGIIVKGKNEDYVSAHFTKSLSHSISRICWCVKQEMRCWMPYYRIYVEFFHPVDLAFIYNLFSCLGTVVLANDASDGTTDYYLSMVTDMNDGYLISHENAGPNEIYF